MGGAAPTMSLEDPEMKKMIDTLFDKVNLCQLKVDAETFNEDLLAKVAKLEERLEKVGSVVTDDDIERWNVSSVKAVKAEEDIEKIHSQL
jgi:hypothetical protein